MQITGILCFKQKIITVGWNRKVTIYRYVETKSEHVMSKEYSGRAEHVTSQAASGDSFKDPLKYLVAKLHGCYPRALSLPVSQNIFARFFSAPARRRFKSQVTVFLLRCNKHKKNFSFPFLLINFLLYGYKT